MKEFIATKCIHMHSCDWGETHVFLFFRVEFDIFLSYMIIAFKILLVKFPNLVNFFFTGQNPRWPIVAILEKKLKWIN